MSTTPTETTELPEHLSEPGPGFHCESCDKYFEDEGETPLYECDNDGTFASDEGNRCPQCNKFAARIGYACPECDEGPVEDATVFHCDKCDAFFEDGEQDEHQHDDEDDDESADPETVAAKGRGRSMHSLPVLATKRAADLAHGDVWARPWEDGSDGAQRAHKGTGAPYAYREVERVEVRDGQVMVWSGVVGLPVGQADDEVQVVTGWERPPGAYEIKARDMRLDHVVLTSPDGRERRGFREVRHSLLTGTVTCSQRARRGDTPVEYDADQTLTVVGQPGKRDLIGDRAWRVEWDRKFAAPMHMDDDMNVVHNPEYDREAPLRQALVDAGIVEGRKITMRDNWAIIGAKRPDLAYRLVDLLREHGFTPASVSEYEQTRY